MSDEHRFARQVQIVEMKLTVFVGSALNQNGSAFSVILLKGKPRNPFLAHLFSMPLVRVEGQQKSSESVTETHWHNHSQPRKILLITQQRNVALIERGEAEALPIVTVSTATTSSKYQ